MLKTPACGYFGHIVYIISHVATGSKHLPAGIPGTSNTSYRALQHAQNTCLQVYRIHRVLCTACCIMPKTPACRCFGHIVYLISHATRLKTPACISHAKKKRKSFGFSEIPPLFARMVLTPNGMGLTFWVPETWSWRCFW